MGWQGLHRTDLETYARKCDTARLHFAVLCLVFILDTGFHKRKRTHFCRWFTFADISLINIVLKNYC